MEAVEKVYDNTKEVLTKECVPKLLKEIRECEDRLNDAVERVVRWIRGGKGSKVGDFTNLKDATVKDVLDRIPDDAIMRELYPVKGGSTEGVEFKWIRDGQTYRVRIHNVDYGAPSGSNAANGWTVRIQRGRQYYE